MRAVLFALLLIVVAGPALAQKQMPRYGEPDPDKTPAELEAERKADRDYRRSLGNVPDAKPNDPWGTMRDKPAPSATAKPAQPKAVQAKPAVAKPAAPAKSAD